jgi:quercetin dioxygenase-like cupin family protein
MNNKTKRETKGFPRFITDLPEADIQFKGVRAWISQGDNHQVIFFDIAASGEVTEHYHETPQWGVVVEGEMELTINGETKVYRKGDEYYIPAKARHSARFKSRSRTVDFFCEKDRYKPKAL